MNTIPMIDAFGHMDDDLIEKHFQAKEALRVKKTKKTGTAWIKWGCIAACLCLVMAVTVVAAYQIQNRLDPNTPGLPPVIDRETDSAVLPPAADSETRPDVSPETDNGMVDQDTLPPNSGHEGEPTDYQFVSVQVQADWPYYQYATEVVEASTHIYHGKVTDISFAIIDQRTGVVDQSPQSSATRRMLYTVYTIEITDHYKGDSPAEVRLCMEGGLIGYKEEEQYNLMNESGLLERYQGIPVCESYGTLPIGAEYLFCISRIGDFDHIISPTQFAYPMDSENSRKIIRACK